MTAAPRLLILGADGFIGRHIAFAARDAGYHVIAHARDPRKLAHMGFDVIAADLTDPACHKAAFWHDALAGGTHVVNAAGLLSARDAVFEAVHVSAPRAVYAALRPDARGVLISAIGIDADTPFARWRRAGEDTAPAQITILRPGLVLGETSYGGSSLARALAVLPWRRPVVGTGAQEFNPMHVEDLAAAVLSCLQQPPPPGPHNLGGPETVTQAELGVLLRGWFGQPPVPALRITLPLARLMGGLGDMMRLGPISRGAVDQLSHGVHAPLSPALENRNALRPVGEFIAARPSGAQDLWHARLYLLRPLLRLTLALLWLVSGILGLTLHPDSFLPLAASTPLPDPVLIALARGGGLADLAIALALLRGWRLPLMAWVQAGMVLAYTVAFTLLNPALWLLPLGGLLKNLPILGLIAVWAVLERER